MLTNLGSAIDGWRPSGGAIGDPLVAARAVWSEIVGADVARAAQPVAIVGSALVIITTSASWSHQLSFLERDIIAKLRERAGVGSIERLRFRIGTIKVPALARPGTSGPRRTRRDGDATSPPRTLEDAVARLRAVMEASRAGHRATGGAFCRECGAAIERGDACRPCRDDRERAIRETCERLLFEAPWLPPEAVLAVVAGLDATTYDAIRRRLLRAWYDQLRLAQKRHAVKAPIDRSRVRKLASSYVLLETKIDPNRLELDSPVRMNALGDLYDFVRAVELGTGTGTGLGSGSTPGTRSP